MTFHLILIKKRILAQSDLKVFPRFLEWPSEMFYRSVCLSLWFIGGTFHPAILRT